MNGQAKHRMLNVEPLNIQHPTLGLMRVIVRCDLAPGVLEASTKQYPGN